MDYFLTSAATPTGPDSLSLQEMLDIDIKSENDYESVFNCGDMNLNFSELPALNLDEDSLGAPGDNNVWLTSSNDSHSLLGGDLSSLSQDLTSGETRMVCPNSVMPVTLIQVPYDRKEKSEKSLLKPVVGKLSSDNNNMVLSKVVIKEEDLDYVPNDAYDSEGEEDDDYGEVYDMSFTPRINNHRIKVRTSGNSVRAMPTATKRVSIKSLNTKRRVQITNIDPEVGSNIAYPKPAYSYSCLIAMALKNSPSGSLPVSEIYNFMCEHFPYFKTAPNGWKNSVRHNLSLNKCFEKIEKPVTNGSQRKGCLWAMNPNKINKMDEEVQKWSKKDKSAIRKSMIYPENLDALERGDLSATGGVYESCEVESGEDEEVWDQGTRSWCFKEESEEEDEEEEEDEKVDWQTSDKDRVRLGKITEEDLEESDISLTDFDIEMTESIYNEAEPGKVNVRVNVQTSPNGAFQPLLSGAYTVKTPIADNSPKRFKTSAGSTITGNYVYKPFGAATIRRKSPMTHSLLSSLEADD